MTFKELKELEKNNKLENHYADFFCTILRDEKGNITNVQFIPKFLIPENNENNWEDAICPTFNLEKYYYRIKETYLIIKKEKIITNISDMEKAKVGIEKGITGLKKAITGIDAGIKGQNTALDKMKTALAQIEKYSANPPTSPSSNPPANIAETDTSQITPEATSETSGGQMSPGAGTGATDPQGPPAGMSDGTMNKDALIKSIKDMEISISKMKDQKNQTTVQLSTLTKKYADLNTAQIGLTKAEKGLTTAVSGINTGIEDITNNTKLLQETSVIMKAVKDAIPQAFQDAKTNYINILESMRSKIDSIFQDGLNNGFKNMYIAVSFISILGILILLGYRTPKKGV